MEKAISEFKRTELDPNRIEMMGAIFTNVDEDVTTEPSKQNIKKKAGYTFKSEMRYTKYYRHSVKQKLPLYRTPNCKQQFKIELIDITDEFVKRVEELNAKRKD